MMPRLAIRPYAGMFDGLGEGIADTYLSFKADPMDQRQRRNKAATSIAEGEAAFQPMAQGLQVLGAGQRGQEIGLSTERLGLDREKFGYQQVADRESLADKQVGREHESRMILDRSLGAYSPYALTAARAGQAPEAALTLGSNMRVKQAGAESWARSGAAAAVDTKKRLNWAQASEVARRVAAAKAAGQPLDYRQVAKEVQAEFGNTPPQAPGRNVLTDEQRIGDDRRKLALKIIDKMNKDGVDEPGEIRNALLVNFDPGFVDEFLGKLRGGKPAGPAIPAAGQADDEEATNLMELFDSGVAAHGPDPSRWPPEVLNEPSMAEAVKRYKESMGQ